MNPKRCLLKSLPMVLSFSVLQAYSQTITTGVITGSPFCPGTVISVPYTTTGTFNSNNVFRAQLSNSSGSFTSPVVIGTRTATTAGTITATIPTNAAAGTAYRIRVISTNPSRTGTDNGSNLTILPAGNCGTSWTTTGNGGITPNNFIGTISDSKLKFKVMNRESGIIDHQRMNTSLGFESLFSSINDSSMFNTAIGAGTMYSNSTGYANTAIGAEAMYSNVSGAHNSSFGYGSLNKNISGLYNTANGSLALNLNTIGNRNTSVGYSTLSSNTNASDNTAVGSSALYTNSTGSKNTASGSQAMILNTTGNENSACGYSSLYSNTTGSQNTSNGFKSMYSNTSGQKNTAIGAFSLYYNSGSSENTSVGFGSLINNISGIRNTAIGTNSLENVSFGSNNTAIGCYADVSGISLNGSTAIGYSATVNINNKVRIGSTSITVIEGQVGYSFPSDGRFKTNVFEKAPGLDLIMKLRPVSYNFEYNKFSEFLHEHDRDEALLSQREKITQYGFIAQEVEKACKDLGLEASNLVHSPESEHDNYSMAYQNLVTPLVKAVQEQQILIEELKKSSNERIAALEARIDAMVLAQGKTGSERAQSHEKAFLGQNIPNPFDHTTSIPFSIPTDCQNARIDITHASTGQSLKTVSLNCKDKQLLLEAGSLQPGNYTYSLIVNGRTVDTKQMVITR